MAKQLKAHNGMNKLHIVLIILVAVAFFGIGFVAQQTISQAAKGPYVCPTIGLSEADKNFLGNLAFAAGTCERMGLATNVLVQKDGNNTYGVPVCVSPPQQTK